MIATGMSTKSERIAAVLLAGVGLFALGLQYALLLQVTGALGLSWGQGTLRFFSYFTIQANILVALMLLAFALRPKIDEWAVHPFERSASRNSAQFNDWRSKSLPRRTAMPMPSPK